MLAVPPQLRTPAQWARLRELIGASSQARRKRRGRRSFLNLLRGPKVLAPKLLVLPVFFALLGSTVATCTCPGLGGFGRSPHIPYAKVALARLTWTFHAHPVSGTHSFGACRDSLSPRLEPIPWKCDEQRREQGSFVRGGSSASRFGRVSSLEGCVSGDQVPLDTSRVFSKAMDTWRHGNNTQQTTHNAVLVQRFSATHLGRTWIPTASERRRKSAQERRAQTLKSHTLASRVFSVDCLELTGQMAGTYRASVLC